MTTLQLSRLFVLSFLLIVVPAALGLTGCQTPVLGIGVPIEDLPPEQGVQIPGLPAGDNP